VILFTLVISCILILLSLGSGCTHTNPVSDTGFPELTAIQYRGTNFIGGKFNGDGGGLTNVPQSSIISNLYWTGTVNGTNVQYGFISETGEVKFKVVIGSNEVTLL
jgi:hypothetical protein